MSAIAFATALPPPEPWAEALTATLPITPTGPTLVFSVRPARAEALPEPPLSAIALTVTSPTIAGPSEEPRNPISTPKSPLQKTGHWRRPSCLLDPGRWPQHRR